MEGLAVIGFVGVVALVLLEKLTKTLKEKEKKKEFSQRITRKNNSLFVSTQ